MTYELTFELDLDSVDVNHHAEYLGHIQVKGHFVQKLTSGQTDRHTHSTD